MKSFQPLLLLLLAGSTRSAVADDVIIRNDFAEDNECHDLASAMQLPSTRLTSRPSVASAAAAAAGRLSAGPAAEESPRLVLSSYQLLERRAQELLTQRVANPVTSFASALTGIPEADIQAKFAEARGTLAQHLTMMVAVPVVFVWITALLYRTCKDSRFASADGRVVGSPDVNQEFKEWSSGPCGCLASPGVCCWACFCPCIRWADTASLVGILGFWVGLWFFFGLVMLDIITGGIVVWFFVAAILTSFRQQLKAKFGMKEGRIIGDCCLFCWCLPCTIAQEARHVDASARRGHPAVGDAIRAKA